MNRTRALLALAAALTPALALALALALAPALALADVVDGTAAKVPSYAARGASDIATLGPLAASLQGKPVMARIHADWCSACKATAATIDAVKQAYGDRISFVEFDVTNARTAAAAQAQADALGLRKFYDSAKSATSTVAVIEPRDGRVVRAFYNDGAADDYKAALDATLKAEGK